MSFTGAVWNEAIPTDSDVANEIDDYMRDIKLAISGRMRREHVWPASQTGTSESGMHTFVTLQAQTSAPTLTGSQLGAVYVDSYNSLVYEDSAGATMIIVPGATAAANGGLAAGIVTPFAGTTAPSGWLMCTGGAYNRTTYARLFNVIGVIWGTGDGSSTFNIPDLRDRVPVSKGTTFATIAATTGEVTHVLTTTEMPAHTHTYDKASAVNNAANWSVVVENDDGKYTSTASGSTGGGSAHNNMQPSIVMNYLIKD